LPEQPSLQNKPPEDQGKQFAMKIITLHLNDATHAELAAHLADAGLQASRVDDVDTLLAQVVTDTDAIVVTALALPDLEEGMHLLRQCQAIDAQLPVITLADRNDAATAVEAIRKGAFEVLTPEQMPRLAQVCRRAMASRSLALEARRGELLDDEEATTTVPGRAPIADVLRGRHASMRRLRTSLLRLARVETDVLVNGDTGCGKEVVARCLHDYGPRANKHFVAINCGAIPENIFESELFGHEAGAFTGAAKRRIGKLEFANGGTVFLDEIESLPMAMQVKLLRALQQRTIERVGGNEPIKLNCRIVAATKDNLLELSRQGRFRLDLYYRLNVIELALPSLKDRREDIPMLAQAFAAEAAQRHGLTDASLDIEFVCGLMAKDWPGNVRELRNAVERQMLGIPEINSEPEAAAPAFSLARQLASFERALIEQSLRACRGSVTKVCELLAVPRKTLDDKLTRLSVDPADFRQEREMPTGRFGYAPAVH
jgi:DNA-binding NtrC family response regulator